MKNFFQLYDICESTVLGKEGGVPLSFKLAWIERIFPNSREKSKLYQSSGRMVPGWTAEYVENPEVVSACYLLECSVFNAGDIGETTMCHGNVVLENDGPGKFNRPVKKKKKALIVYYPLHLQQHINNPTC